MFGFSKIKGGIHPSENKDLSTGTPITEVALPDYVVIPLNQHLGAPAELVVAIGDYVKAGQIIAEAAGFISAPIHASVSGTVSDINDYKVPHVSGLTAKCIKIDRQGDEWQLMPKLSLDSSAELLLNRIKESGLTGMGGASFPTNVKYLAKDKINTLIVNAAECEPYITADDMLMRERADKVISGIRIAQKILEPEQVIIGIEDNKPEAIKILKSELKQVQSQYGLSNINVKVIPTKYPSGGEKQLIQILTGKQVPSGELPASLGILCQNVGTLAAFSDAVFEGKPLTSRVVTITGKAVKDPRNFEARIGTPVKHLLESADLQSNKLSRLIVGGPMMGQIMSTDEIPLVKGSGGILALMQDELPKASSSPCVRCGRCVSACPMGLVPLEMARHSKANDYDGAKDYGLSDCILCGSCAFVCPSHIPLVQYFQFAKGELNQQSSTNKRLEYTRKLSDAKRLRLQKEAEAKAAAKAAKAAKGGRRKKRTSAETE